MNNIPKVTKYIDKEEKKLIAAIEHSRYKISKNSLTLKRLKDLQMSARATINDERTPISIRIPKTDLSLLKARAMQEGIPYQTLINSILHKAVNY